MRERKPLRESDSPYCRGKGEWVKSDWYCIACGKQDVWQWSNEGEDYYLGCSATCHSCGHTMVSLDKLKD